MAAQERRGKYQFIAQAISDLHHLVGEYVVLCDDSDRNLAGELGIDFIEVGDSKEISTEELVLTMPLLIR